MTRSALMLFALGFAGLAQSRDTGLPRFKDYPAGKIFSGTPPAPKLGTQLARSYADQIRDGVKEGFGVFVTAFYTPPAARRLLREQEGPNFAGRLIVIQWGCGSPCLRMAIVDAQSGDMYYPPISANGLGAGSFDLPLLIIGNSVSGNADVQFRLDSNLMIIKATPSQAGRHPAYTYYFLWRQNRWALLRKIPLHQI